MKAIAVLLLIIFIVDGQSTYSIDAFLDYLQENGYYEIILQVKITFGDDIAIDVCKQLVQTNDCEIVVKTYMTGSHSMNCPSVPHNYIELKNKIKTEPSKDFIDKIERLLRRLSPDEKELVFLLLSFYDILIKKMSEDQIFNLIIYVLSNNIIKIIKIC